MADIPEVKSLRWLANMFPYVEKPQDETDRMSNAIHIYCSAGADKIEELSKLLVEKNIESHANNGDKIRNMSNEDLAFCLMCPYDSQELPECSLECIITHSINSAASKECYSCVLNWLNKKE